MVRKDFGSISVQFAPAIHVKEFAAAHAAAAVVDPQTKEPISLVTDLAYTITESMVQKATCTPSHLVATILLLFRNGISKSVLVTATPVDTDVWCLGSNSWAKPTGFASKFSPAAAAS